MSVPERASFNETPVHQRRIAVEPSRDLNLSLKSATLIRMSTVNEIESAITELSLEEKQAVRDWLDDLIEDQLEVSDEFKAKIQRAKQEIADGVYSRVRKPEATQ